MSHPRFKRYKSQDVRAECSGCRFINRLVAVIDIAAVQTQLNMTMTIVVLDFDIWGVLQDRLRNGLVCACPWLCTIQGNMSRH
jgi:hypothetical protein